MDTPQRTIAKSFCWQAIGLAAMLLIGYAYTGSIGQGGAIALTGMASGFVTYFLHERAWAKVRWGRRPEPATRNDS